MEIVIDDFSDISAWTSNSSLIGISLCQFVEHRVKGIQSIRVRVAAGCEGKYFEKTYAEAQNVSDVKNLRFFMSKYLKGLQVSDKERENFKLKVAVGNKAGDDFELLDEWFVPLVGCKNMAKVNIELGAVTSFETIRFTVIGNEAEVWWLSYIIGCTDEFVVDSLKVILNELDCKVKFFLGNPTALLAVGDTGLDLPEWANITKYSVIQIEELGIVERHQVAGEVSNGRVEFDDESFFDGPMLKNAFTALANLYLVVPSMLAGKNSGIAVPGIFITGLIPTLPEIAGGETLYDSYKVNENKKRALRVNRDISLPLQIEVQAVQPEMMIAINNFIQNLFSDIGSILVNGNRYDLLLDDAPKYDAGDYEADVPYCTHFYSVSALDVLNASIDYVTIPSAYHTTINFN